VFVAKSCAVGENDCSVTVSGILETDPGW